MTAEQLEELAAGRNPNFIQDMDWEEIITSLARRVLAAEKLVEALEFIAETESWQANHATDALTSYREASK